MKFLARLLLVIVTITVVAYGAAWYFAGGWALYYLKGGRGWPEVSRHDIRLSSSMRLALSGKVPLVHAGAFAWRTLKPGFEVAEVPVLSDRGEVDRLYLERIDPSLYTFSVHNEANRRWTIGDWEKQLPQAALIVNGSFFAPDRKPDTPFISNGQNLGPSVYDARAGVFVAGPAGAHVVDLTDGAGWQAAVQGADTAMVAYPLLIGKDGQSHVTVTSDWLANRTFVAQDETGYIVIGSTKEAFFSLAREADFLRAALPDLSIALNLDGGPVACRSLRIGGVHSVHIARWEAQTHGDKVWLLNWFAGESDMPVVLAVTPK